MIYQREAISGDVRVVLDRNNVSGNLFRVGDIDTLSIDEIIVSKIAESVRSVELLAPLHLLDSGENLDGVVYWDGMNSGYCLLPDDFMRLLVFEMSDWERAVYTVYSDRDAVAKLQSSRFKGLRGTSEKPVCVLRMLPEGKALYFYSCKSDKAWVKQGIYLSYPSFDEDGGIKISERCYESILYMIGSKVCQTVGELEKSKLMLELSKTMLR